MVKNAIIGEVVDILSTKEGTSKKGTNWVLREVLIKDNDGDCYKVPIMNVNLQKGAQVCIPFDYEGKELSSTWINVIKPIGVFSPLIKKETSNNKQTKDSGIDSLPF
jgi:hypothetical protein